MSADSPRRGVHKGAQVVSPQPIVDRSIIDSVAGIINDIVPQAYTGAPNSDNKESISWARFEYADVNDPALYPDYNEGSSTPPLLLVLGYTTGVQVWLISATGEATEVLSWRQGIVRTLRILPNPKTDEEHNDLFEQKRPMVAICDSAGPGPQFCSVSFISLKTGEQAKSIKFKNPVCDVLANRRSVAVTFLEKVAVFDARTLEDVLTITTCYPSPGPNPNPVALGTRWFAYSEKKLLPAKRSSGGCEGEGVQSYTATVLYAAKSLGKGLRGLGETVASSLTGNSVSPVTLNNAGNDVTQPGVVTILDLQAAKEEKELDDGNLETVIAHFQAHTDAIVAMTFDLTGALLMTADKRGHDFHVFRIQPHPGGPTLAAVHHLYILHRGDTTAKVQDMTFSSDTRWAAISTVRGTTHVFPVAPYGGPVGVRTHSTPHVVNRLSRFHRSAGLTDDGARSHSPVSHAELPLSVYPYSNPRLPPYPHPTILHPLAQIRQPSSLNHTNNQSQPSRPQQRQRLHSDDSGTLPLKICACFAPPRAWLYAQRDSSNKVIKRAVDSLFIMACHGNMIQYDLEPKPAAGVPKEKVCDDTMIELEVEAKGQWPLLRSPNSLEIVPPLPLSSPLLTATNVPNNVPELDSSEDRWLSQVEIVTHAGPHRRLWMGPQFVFKTYNAPSGVAVNLVEAEAVEVGVTGGSRPARSNPVNMPHAASRPSVPVVIDGSGSSYEQSPRFMEAYGDPLDGDSVGIGSGENQLREDLAEAMLETSIAPHRAPGRRSVFERVGPPVTKVVNPLGTVITVSADEEPDVDDNDDDNDDGNYVKDSSGVLDLRSSHASAAVAPGPPRSICAEEGPASLGDLEISEAKNLGELTEICAEMRSASEPAIDSVPDENIREVKERRSLCVEVAAAGRCSSIDFEREEAFKDVPTSLSLCVEEGEIPNSPMTQAKETIWCRKSGRKNDGEVHERNLMKAKYVVNYDEESVVLMENSSGEGKCEGKCPMLSVTKDSKQACSRKTVKTEKASTVKKSEPKKLEKYIVKEHEDSIVIEDRCKDLERKDLGRKPDESKDSSGTKCKAARTTKKQDCKYNVSSRTGEKSRDSKDSFVELSKFESSDVIDKETVKTEEKTDLPSLELPLDDFSSIEYHVVESNCSKDTGSFEFLRNANQSDDDIEHVQAARVEKSSDQKGCREFSPVAKRKNSKSTISDDDLEYIHSSEISETVEKEHAVGITVESLAVSLKKPSKNALSSDDDLEHVLHSDVCEDSRIPDLEDEESGIGKSQDVPAEQGKPKYMKKRKDIVVIESDTSEPEVTVIVKQSETRGRSKTPEQDESDKGEAKEHQESSSPRKSKRGSLKSSLLVSKRSQSVEIIDIDAMQKEMETDATPECKILSPRHENVRSRKSRKNKKPQEQSNLESSYRGSQMKAELQDAVEDSSELAVVQERKTQVLSAPIPELSWSAIVKKKPAASENEICKEPDLEPVIEVEEKSELDERSCKQTDSSETRASTKTLGNEESPLVESSMPSENVQNKHDVLKNEIKETREEEDKNVESFSKENSPDPEPRKSDSEQECPAERSSSSDEYNTNVMAMDTEEDCLPREICERNTVNGTGSSNTAKKSGRSKKKKRR